jgi:acyl transferase domain-containing protein
VGGGTLLTAPEWFGGLSQGGFLSPTGACKTYSDSADGYCRGKGVAVVVLKRLTDAIRAKDDVLAVIAVIAGAARNCNAGAGSITHPGERAQEALYRRVLRQAAVRPHDVDVVEMHGTGTQAGDRVETNVVRNVFASPTEQRRPNPLIVGAIKANIGHSGAAAGVVSLIKAILILHRNTIPPRPGQPISLNPHLAPILGSDMQLANGQEWPRNGKTPRYVFINNFDAAGGNVSMLIHDAPSFALPPPPKPDSRTYHVVATSGRTTTAHEANRVRLLKYLKQRPDTQLADLAYTTTARRMHRAQRGVYAVGDITELVRQLEQPLKSSALVSASSVVFAFTGQGSQHVGMGSTLYRTSPTFRRILDSYQHLYNAQGLDCQFLDTITAKDRTATDRDLQIATVALEIALARYWQSLGLHPTLVIGHSLGEYAALCIAGVLSVSDALALAYERATLIFTKCRSSKAGMLAVALQAGTVRYRLRDSAKTAECEVSCINGPSSTVVGGPASAIGAFNSYLKSDSNVATTCLRVKHAFHTRQLDPVLDDLESSASRVTFLPPTVPVASTLLGKILRPGKEGVFNANYIRRHTREPVAFLEAVRACETEALIKDDSFVIEISPHPTCIGLITSSLQRTTPSSYPRLSRGHDNWEAISQCIAAAHRAQLPIAWAEFHKDHLDSVRLINDLPTYAFDLKSFWITYKTKRVPVSGSDEIPRALPSAVARLPYTCLHSVDQLQKERGRMFATFTADLSDQKLAKAIGGHVVDGVAICPASIFIDMAYTVAIYFDRESSNIPSADLATYEMTSLTISSPLVLRKDIDEPPHVWLEGAFEQSTGIVSVHFLSSGEGVSLSQVEHGSCTIQLNQDNGSFTHAWSRIDPLIKAGVRSLEAASRPREVHSMDTRLFYKVFSEIVDYSAPYHAVEEATVAAD